MRRFHEPFTESCSVVPELPEVETIRRTLEPLVVGRRIERFEVRRASLRWPLPADLAARLCGRSVCALDRRAKYLIVRLDDGAMWLIHFGMSGRLMHSSDAEIEPQKHDHVLITLSDGGRLTFNDPRRFGYMRLEYDVGSGSFAGLGPEPLDERAFGPNYLVAMARKTRRTIKDVLMDQRVVAGLGNIYVNEALYLAGVRPGRGARRLTRAECRRVVESVRAVLVLASTVRIVSARDGL
jgi:formamidopyrimidine-DNA glycosylase